MSVTRDYNEHLEVPRVCSGVNHCRAAALGDVSYSM